MNSSERTQLLEVYGEWLSEHRPLWARYFSFAAMISAVVLIPMDFAMFANGVSYARLHAATAATFCMELLILGVIGQSKKIPNKQFQICNIYLPLLAPGLFYNFLYIHFILYVSPLDQKWVQVGTYMALFFTNVFLYRFMIEQYLLSGVTVGLLFLAIRFFPDKKNDLLLFVTFQVVTGVFAVLLRREFVSSLFTKKQREDLDAHVAASVAQAATQTAHDIRSPLAALKAISADLPELSEEKRVLLQTATARINDIANDLLSRADLLHVGKRGGRNGSRFLSPSKLAVELRPKVESVHLVSAIDRVATEKRFQYKSLSKIKLEFEITQETYPIFIAAVESDLKRVFSNLIDNAVEAMNEGGDVRTSISAMNGAVALVVRDNGKGIPSDMLPKLGKRGATFGKTKGTGLGLHYSISTAESWGGSLDIQSKEGQGTSIVLKFPIVAPPVWFVESITLQIAARIVIVDDELNIHQLWDYRFKQLSKNRSIEVVHLYNPMEVSSEIGSKPGDATASLYLIDYEFAKSEVTGIDLILKYNLNDKAVLTTNRYDEINIRSSCEMNRIKLLSKIMVGYVPVKQLLSKN